MTNNVSKNNELLNAFISATEISNRGAIWLTSKGSIVGVNQNFAQQIGYEKKDFVGKMIFEINPYFSVMDWRKLWNLLLIEKQHIQEGEHLSATEELIPVKIRWELVEIGDEQYVCGIVEDLISSNRYEDLLNIASEISNVVAWEWDVLHKKLFFTNQLRQLLKLDIDQTLDAKNTSVLLSKLLASRSLKMLLFKITASIKSGDSFDLELNLRNKGTAIPASIILNARPLVVEDRTLKIYGTIQDLSNIADLPEKLYLTNFCMDYAQECILWVDETGQVIYANQAAALTYDYLPEEFKTKTVTDFIPIFKEKEYSQHWEELRERGMMEYEAIHQKKDGSLFPVWVSLNFIRYKDKTINCIFLKDLTDQKAQEDQWKLTQLTVDMANEMIFWIRPDGSYEYVNDKVCETLGYSREEIFEISPFSIIEEYSESSWPTIWENLKKDKSFEAATYSNTKSGKKIPVAVSVTYIEFGEKVLGCAFVRDLSKKKTKDEQIKLSMSTIDGASDMIFWLDKNATIFYTNEEAAKNLGYSNKELIGISLFKITPIRNKEEWGNHWEKIKQNRHLVYEALMNRKSGKVFPVEVTLNYIMHEGKEMLSAYVKDITKRKAEALKLEMAYEEIKELKEAAEEENTILKDEIKLESGFHNIISNSPNYKKVLKQVEQVADANATVLISGETGTGKELLARAIHELSPRAEKAMIKINCGALPANLIESELFGYEKGAFTGAAKTKKGRFELAHKGTIFLDEIGELPIDLQSKLLRVLQEGEFEKLGDTKTIKVDVRVIAATNRDLAQKVANKTFRADLFYRLNVFPIYNIPLRERKEDILPLVSHFIDKYSKKMGKKIKEISKFALKKLTRYDFPGNIRELENIIERAIILTQDEKLSFDTSLFQNETKGNPTFLSLEEAQRQHIIAALKWSKGKISGTEGAASILQINDKTLTSRMKKLGISRKDF